jgi:hypothetical protein
MTRLALLAALCLALHPTLAAQAPAPPVSVAAFEGCSFPADSLRFLVVLDQSGSMEPHWDAVRRTLPAIVRALPDGSSFQLELFASEARTGIVSTRVTPGTREELRQQLQGLPAPDPAGATDIGAALQRAGFVLDHQAKQGGGPVAFVFVVTDGRHAPPPGSPYPDAASSWRPLRPVWDAVRSREGGTVLTYLVPIGAGGMEGAAAVRTVIPDATPLPQQSPGVIGDAIAAEIALATSQLRKLLAGREVAAPRLRADVAGGGHAVGFWGSTPVPVRVTSSALCVSYELAGAGPEGANLLVPPGGSADVTLPVRSALGWGALPWSGVRTDTTGPGRAASPAVETRVGFEPRGRLAALGVTAAPAAAALRPAGTLAFEPMGWGSFLAIAGAALTLALLTGLRVARPPRLWGTVQPAGGAAVDLGEKDTGSYLLELDGGARLRFVARKLNPFGDGYHSRVGVRAEGAARVEAVAPDDPETARAGDLVWLEPGDRITVTRTDPGAPPTPTTLTWG